jgi:hypothetical protein
MATKKKTAKKRTATALATDVKSLLDKHDWPHGLTLKSAEGDFAKVVQSMQRLLDTTPTKPPTRVGSDGNRHLLDGSKQDTGGPGNIRFP